MRRYYMKDNDFVKAAAVAQNTIIERVYNPVFYKTISELYGAPRSQEEAKALLKIASALILRAKELGLPSEPEPPSYTSVKSAATMLEKDDVVKKAAIVLDQGGVVR